MTTKVKYALLLLETALAMLGIGAVDYFTGYQLSFSIFYLIPIAFFSLHPYSRRGSIVAFAIFAALIWWAVEYKINNTYSSIFFPIWNASVRLTTFIIVGLSLSALKARNYSLNKLNKDLHELWSKLSLQNSELEEAHAKLNAEKDKSDNLLLNILPEKIADELKHNGAAEPTSYDEASVLFTDFVGFTTLADKMNANDLVEELNICFTAFDTIVAKHGIEKIKTIGDSYMAAAGIPSANNTHAVDVINAALEMIDFMNERAIQCEQNGKPHFEVRIGINSGSIVAGIVGSRKFQYDIWGDTVNVASRMESNGYPGKVNVSASTYELVKANPSFQFEERGFVEIKGKGAMEMYFVSKV